MKIRLRRPLWTVAVLVALSGCGDDGAGVDADLGDAMLDAAVAQDADAASSDGSLEGGAEADAGDADIMGSDAGDAAPVVPDAD